MFELPCKDAVLFHMHLKSKSCELINANHSLYELNTYSFKKLKRMQF